MHLTRGQRGRKNPHQMLFPSVTATARGSCQRKKKNINLSDVSSDSDWTSEDDDDDDDDDE